LKLNNSDSLAKMDQPISAITGSVDDALRLGCVAIGYTIYPGSGARNRMYEDLRELTAEAKSKGLAVVVWSYPRGAGISKDGELAIDVVAYGAQIAAQLGAHIIKVKPPKDFIEQSEAKKVFEKYNIPTKTLSDRIRHVVQSSFAGKRIVIFRGEGGRELLTETLRERGALVEHAVCYRRVRPDADPKPLLHAWRHGTIHAVSVMSGESLDNFYAMLSDDGRTWLRATATFVPHQRIAARANELSIARVYLTGPSDDALIDKLIDVLCSRPIA